MTKKILEVCLSPDLGGLELYMNKCAKALSSKFEVISVIAKNSKLENFYEHSEDEFVTLKRKSSFSIPSALKLAKIIDKQEIDLIHIHWTKDIPIIVLAKIFSKRKPKIIQTRHMTMTRFKDDFYHKFLYKNIDFIIAVTKELENQMNRFIPKDIRPKIETLYLGAQCPDMFDKNEIYEYKASLNTSDSFMIGLIGRINEFKGQHLLIEAMNILENKDYNIKSFFLGHAMSEEYLQSLKTKVTELKLDNKIEFLGFSKEPHKFMQACDVVLMTSRNETFGLVTIEAMQMQTAVIGSNSGGVLEIIDDEETGLLFTSEDAQDLALKIEKLYLDENLKNRLALNGQEKANEKFNNKKQFEKLLSLVDSI